MKKFLIVLVTALMVLPVSLVSAHVVVKPAEVPTGTFQTFTVSVPNEKSVANTKIKLLIPSGLEHVTPTVKPGWKIAMAKTGKGEDAKVQSITWSGSSIAAGFRDDFTFSAKVPAEAGELQWKAYQAYADGITVAWDVTEDKQPKKADGSPDFSKSGPLSVTKLTAEAAEKNPASTAQPKSDSTARTMAGVALATALASFAIVTRPSDRKSPKK